MSVRPQDGALEAWNRRTQSLEHQVTALRTERKDRISGSLARARGRAVAPRPFRRPSEASCGLRVGRTWPPGHSKRCAHEPGPRVVGGSPRLRPPSSRRPMPPLGPAALGELRPCLYPRLEAVSLALPSNPFKSHVAFTSCASTSTVQGAIATEAAASATAGAAEMGGGPAQPDVSSWFADPEGGRANADLSI